MVVPDLLFALVIAVVFTAVFVIGFGRKGPWASVPGFFIIVFLGAWAGGAWASPVGPPLWGVFWLPFLFMGLAVALLLAAAAPPPSTVKIESPNTEQQEERKVIVAFEFFFWILLITLLIAIVSRYIE